jgi:molybdate transport system ATP-binding protein
MEVRVTHSIEQGHDIQLHFEMDICVDALHSIVGVFGKSGAGKTTIIKIMAGLIPNAHCTMRINNKDYINQKGHNNPCVYVGADSPLFEHLNVLDNLTLIIRHSASRTQHSFSIEDVIEMCGLATLVMQFPSQISSGEKQRVCFARALLTGKKILLLDEAFSALDWVTRQLMHQQLKRLVAEHNYSAFMVSHSLKELSLCASKLITIEQGAVLNYAPIDVALKYQLETIQTRSKQDYFAVIKAKFSHIDEQDNALAVWQVDDELNSQDACLLYVKAPSMNNAENNMLHTLNTPKEREQRTFVLDAYNVSVSRIENKQTSMVNCFPVTLNNIVLCDDGVVLSGNWHSQTIRALITLKSFKTLNIKTNESVYFVCKALT